MRNYGWDSLSICISQQSFILILANGVEDLLLVQIRRGQIRWCVRVFAESQLSTGKGIIDNGCFQGAESISA